MPIARPGARSSTIRGSRWLAIAAMLTVGAYATPGDAQTRRSGASAAGDWPSVEVNLDAIDEAYGTSGRGRSIDDLRPVRLVPPRAVRRAQTLERDLTTNPLLADPQGRVVLTPPQARPEPAPASPTRPATSQARGAESRTASTPRGTVPTVPAAPRIAAPSVAAPSIPPAPAPSTAPQASGPETSERPGKPAPEVQAPPRPAPQAGAPAAPQAAPPSSSGPSSSGPATLAAPSRAPTPTTTPTPTATPAPPAASAPAPAPAPAPIQEAARPPAGAKHLGAGDQVRVPFAKGQSELTEDARAPLKSIVEALSSDSKLRVELQAFADGTADTASQARRLSLSRALSIRSYLIEQGLVSTRMDVRALGNRFESGPPDRVDVVISER